MQALKSHAGNLLFKNNGQRRHLEWVGLADVT